MQKNIGERLRMVRGGISREVFADRYGIHPNTLARWERNERPPLDSVLNAVAAGEKINPDWLKVGRGEIVYQEDVEEQKPAPGTNFTVHEDVQPLEISQPEKTNMVPGATFAAAAMSSDLLPRLLTALDDNAALLREIADLREARARLEARVAALEAELATHTRAGGMTAAPSGDG